MMPQNPETGRSQQPFGGGYDEASPASTPAPGRPVYRYTGGGPPAVSGQATAYSPSGGPLEEGGFEGEATVGPRRGTVTVISVLVILAMVAGAVGVLLLMI